MKIKKIKSVMELVMEPYWSDMFDDFFDMFKKYLKANAKEDDYLDKSIWEFNKNLERHSYEFMKFMINDDTINRIKLELQEP